MQSNVLHNFFKEYTLTDFIVHIYNLSIALFILFNISKYDYLWKLFILHIGLIFILQGIILARNRLKKEWLNFLMFFLPLILLTFFHYETGLLNQIIFPKFFDEVIQKVDLTIFGILPNRVLSKIFPYDTIHQAFHFFYFTYYFLLFIPVLAVYLKERNNLEGNINSTNQNLCKFKSTQNMLFVILFVMFICYWIFIIFPVAGPTAERSYLFPDAGGFISIMNYLFKVGDLDGGAMPSSHVAVSLAVVLLSYKYLSKYFTIILIDFILLTISTVYCSYHYAIDVICGLAVGGLLYYLGEMVFKKLKGIGIFKV